MSAEIVNLRRARKAVARTGREAAAAANRASHGRTATERAGAALETGRASRLLDGAKLERGATDDDRRERSPADGA